MAAMAMTQTQASSQMRRNFLTRHHRRDQLIDFFKEILRHGFVLNVPETYNDSMLYFEELILEHHLNPANSRLKNFVPTVGKFHTPVIGYKQRCASQPACRSQAWPADYSFSTVHKLTPTSR